VLIFAWQGKQGLPDEEKKAIVQDETEFFKAHGLPQVKLEYDG